MDRRTFLVSTSAAALLPATHAQANPLFWVARGLMGLGTRRAAQTAVGATVRGGAIRGTGRAAASARSVSNVVPYAARNPSARSNALSILNSGLTAASIGLALSGPAQASYQNQGNASPEASAVAYYALLSQTNRNAQLAMWIDPPRKHFQATNRTAEYYIHTIERGYYDGTVATTYVDVSGKNRGESWQRWRLEINWLNTEYGWLITSMHS